MKAIIVDDEPDGISTLKKIIASNCKQVDIIATCADAIEGRQKVEELKPDVVFLDIQMPGKSGLEMLAELEMRNFEVVFVTAYSEYILQALQLSATDYLLKPVHENRLTEAVQRVEKKLRQKGDNKNIEALIHNLQRGNPAEMKLCVPTFKGFVLLKVEDIIICEAKKNYTFFHLGDKKSLIASRPLAEYEKLLESASFFRVHKTFLVNLQHIIEYHRGEGGVLVMSNGTEVEISRRKKEEFLSRIKGVYRH